MPWTCTATAFHGNKAAPAKGNYVTVELTNPDLPEEQRCRYLTYTFDGRKTKAQFLAMVKAEVANHIADWNTTLPVTDATADFQAAALVATAALQPAAPGEGGEGAVGAQPCCAPRDAPPATRKTARASSRSKSGERLDAQ